MRTLRTRVISQVNIFSAGRSPNISDNPSDTEVCRIVFAADHGPQLREYNVGHCNWEPTPQGRHHVSREAKCSHVKDQRERYPAGENGGWLA